tara:strand:+ start:316 stop:525 length:210 start_codon:yes stop_codon:yes gene_type:complete
LDKTDKKLAKNMRPKKKKYNPKYTKGSSNVKRRKQLMDKIAHFYETKKQPYSAADKKKLDKMMKERDKI